MPSTTSPNARLELQATNENDGTWGTKANANFSILDLNRGGRLATDASGNSDVTLTDANARNVYHNITGTLTGSISYIFPASYGGFYIINNATSGAYTVTVEPSGGTGVVVTQGTVAIVFIDPDNTEAVLVDPLTVLTTRGDLLTRGASENARLPIGAANTLLTTDGTDPSWGTLAAIIAAHGTVAFADNVLSRPEIIDYSETVNALGSVSGATNIDIASGNVVTATIGGDTDFTFTNPSTSGKACKVNLLLTNAGAHTITFADENWAGGAQPAFTAAGRDWLTAVTLDAGTIWDMFLAGADMS